MHGRKVGSSRCDHTEEKLGVLGPQTEAASLAFMPCDELWCCMVESSGKWHLMGQSISDVSEDVS